MGHGTSKETERRRVDLKERNGEKRRDEKNSKKNKPCERSENDKLEQIAKNWFFISRFTGFII